MQPKRATKPDRNLEVTQILRRYPGRDPRAESATAAQLRAIKALVRAEGVRS